MAAIKSDIMPYYLKRGMEDEKSYQVEILKGKNVQLTSVIDFFIKLESSSFCDLIYPEVP